MTSHRNVEALPTLYEGVTFRSRTEARWAVFFNTAGLTYEYEKKRISLSSGPVYWPDFWLPDFKCWFEVKAAADSIVTEEATKARQLSADIPGQRVWLAVGPPTADVPNILLLNEWPLTTSIDEILSTSENRYRFLEDRRDADVYWLQADFVTGGFRHSFMVGGPGMSTDHDRLPLLHRRVANAYEASRIARWS